MSKTVQPEKIIETTILDYLNAKRIFAWKNQSTGVFDPSKNVFRKSRNIHAINGVSDILGIHEGRMLAIEVKTPKALNSIIRNYSELKNYFGDDKSKNSLRDQIHFLERVIERGGTAFFASSIEHVTQGLKL